LTTQRLGVLGGSFNPVHLGHLHVAERSREIFGLSQVLFVVASVPPHKSPQDLIPFAHRYAMVTLATSGNAHLFPSMVELEPPNSPFSIDTLAKLARHFGATGKDLYFIAGADSLLDVTGWHDSENLLMSYNFIFVVRPGVETPDVQAILPLGAASRVIDCRNMDSTRVGRRIAAELAAPECCIFLVDIGAPDVAASQIRRLACLGQSIDDLVPARVQEYIVKLHLYGD
jgi:nicotinate-nucleotide adenylyltransferase